MTNTSSVPFTMAFLDLFRRTLNGWVMHPGSGMVMKHYLSTSGAVWKTSIVP